MLYLWFIYELWITELDENKKLNYELLGGVGGVGGGFIVKNLIFKIDYKRLVNT